MDRLEENRKSILNDHSLDVKEFDIVKISLFLLGLFYLRAELKSKKMIWQTYCVLILSFLVLTVHCSKHQAHHKSKSKKKEQKPHYILPLSQVEIQTEQFTTQRPENTSSHLQSALDVLAPENDPKLNSEYPSPLLMKTVTENLHSELPRSSNGLTNTSRSDVVFEVIDMGSFAGIKSRLNLRFILFTVLYVASGIISIIAAYCIARVIVARRKRHKQYMLLTKSDMEYHRGGGGI